jgi:hypothetical protein
MTGDGLLAQPAEEAPPVWVCSPFEMLGEARSPEGEGWSKWIRWRDADGRAHEMPVEAPLLHKANGDLEARLADGGLRVSADPKARGLLRQALAGVRSGTRATLVPQPGWAVLGDGSRGYVFPDGGTAGGAPEASGGSAGQSDPDALRREILSILREEREMSGGRPLPF